MIITKELLEKLEVTIGHDCTVIAMPHNLGLILRATVKDKETGNLFYKERIFSFAEMMQIRDASLLQDNFALEAKHCFANEFTS